MRKSEKRSVKECDYRNFVKIETTYICPRCRNRLVLIESCKGVLLGCEKCNRYVFIDRETVSNCLRGRKFNFVKLLKNMYHMYQEDF